MYLVTAKTKATAQDFPGSTVEWAVGQTREVHDSLIQEFKNNPAAWTVSGGATTSTVTATSSDTTAPVALGPQTNIARVYCTTDCFVAFTVTPVVSAATKPVFIAAGIPEYFRVSPGARVVVRADSSIGVLHLNEMGR